MKSLLLFLRVMLFVLLFFLIVRMGLRLLFFGFRFWYITIPALLLAYLLLTNYLRNRKAHKEFLHSPYHPYQEVRPEKEPEVTEADNEKTEQKTPTKKDQEDS